MDKLANAFSKYLLFWLTLTCILICGGYAFWKGENSTLDSLPIILGIYCGTNAGKTVSAHINARLDEDADLHAVIQNTEQK